MPAKLSLTRLFIVLLLIAANLPFSQASAAGTPLPELLGPGLDAATMAQPGSAARRERAAVLNLAEVEHARTDLDAGRTPVALGLNLFADTNLVARFERVEHLQNGGYTLSGRIDGSPFAEIHLSVMDGAMYASLNTAQGLYRIASPDGRTANITQVDPSLLPPEGERLPAPGPASADVLAPTAVTAGPSTTDDGSRIDVYVGYTATARAQAGGTAAIQSLIATAIGETNTGYANSGINQRVVLVGSGEYAYSEVGFNWSTTLSRWSNPGDAVFGPAHTLRNVLKADEMVLLVADTGYCGLAWLMDSGSISTAFASSSFGVVSRTCATGYYSFGHEMGHNMGAHHDRITAGSNQGAYPYSYGYQWFDSVNSVEYRTVMAYNVYGSDIRINYWSNPNVLFLGRNATGVDVTSPSSAYNTLTLNNTAPFVAMFRDGAAPAAPTNLSVSALSATSYRLNWTDNSTDEFRFRIERTPNGLASWSEIGTAAANATTYTDNTAASGISYQYRVLSDNGNGRSVSNIASAPSVPLSPSGLVVTSSSLTSAALSWTDNSSNETLFRIKRAPAAVNTWSDLGTVGANTTTFTDSTVPDGSGYRYQVFAENAGVPSVGSNIANLPAMPAAPSALTATGLSPTSLKLDWTDNATSEDGYKIERSLDNGAIYQPLVSLAANTITYSDTSAACGVNSYRVNAYNARGSSAFAVTSGTTAPCKPIFTSAPGTTSIYLSWAAVSGAQSYHVEMWDSIHNSYAAVSPLITLADPTAFRVLGLTPTTTYQLRVVATNTQGDTPADPAYVQTMSFSFFLPITIR